MFFRNASRSLDELPLQWEHRHSDRYDEGCSEQSKTLLNLRWYRIFRSGWKLPYRSLHLTLSRSPSSTRIEKRCSGSCLTKPVCFKSRCIHTKESMRLLGKVRKFRHFSRKKQINSRETRLVRPTSPSVTASKKNTAWNEIFSQEIRSLRTKILYQESLLLGFRSTERTQWWAISENRVWTTSLW